MAVYPERRKGKLTGKWIAEVTQSGKRRRDSFPTKKEADQWEGYLKLTGAPPPQAMAAPSGPTFGQVVKEMIADKPAGADPSGRARLEYVVQLIGEDTPFDTVDTPTLDKLVRDLKKRPGVKRGDTTLSPGTINRYLSAASSVLHYGRVRRYRDTSPVVPWQADDGKRIHWLTEDAEKAVVAFMDEQGWVASALVARVLTQTGMRWGELASLKAEQVEPNTGWVRLWKTKNGTARSVPIERALALELRRLVDAKGLPNYYTFRKHLTQAAKSAGQSAGFSIHALRHTTATRLIHKGVPMPVVQKYLGHKTIITTMKYTHIGDTDLQGALEKISQHAGQSEDNPKEDAA